jgi:hypothetical protein
MSKETVKTVLVPDAPWHDKPAVKKKREPRPPKPPSKIAKTNKMFEQWASKNLGVNT